MEIEAEIIRLMLKFAFNFGYIAGIILTAFGTIFVISILDILRAKKLAECFRNQQDKKMFMAFYNISPKKDKVKGGK